MHYGMTNKFRKDIKNNVKNVVLKTVQRLEQKKDFEAGSGTLYIGQEMNSFQIYYVIVDNVRYRIDEHLFNSLEEGGKVAFHYGPASNYLITLAASG